MITAGIGRFGPYLKHGPVYKSLAKDDDVLSIGLNRAISLLAEPKGANRRGGAPGKPLGDHPADGAPVTLHEGRYGPYVKHGKVNATLPKSLTPDQVTLEQAVAAAGRAPRQDGRQAAGQGPQDELPPARRQAGQVRRRRRSRGRCGAVDPQARGGEPEAPAPQDQEAGERDMSKAADKRAAAVPTVQVENERVKVTEWRFAPGAATGWHRHGYDYVVVPMTTGRLQLEDGKETHFAELTAGRSYYRPVGVEHDVINANEFEFVFVEVEFKAP